MITLELSERSEDMLSKMPDLAVPAIFKGMTKALFVAEREAKLNLSGRVLNRRTGRLRNSIAHEAKISGDTVTGRIGTNVIYGRIHEFGGEITPKKAAALKFEIPGVGWRTVKKVTMPKRPFLRPAIMDSLEEISKIIGKEIVTAFKNL